MKEKEKNNQSDDQAEIAKVIPAESPSENFLVTEHLQRMPKIYSRGLIYLIVIILTVAMIYSLVSKIDVVVVCNSVARPVSHKIKILSNRDGYIENIFISEGQEVEKNSPLFCIRSKETLTYKSKVLELHSSIPLKKEYYETKISAVQEELRQNESNINNTLMVKTLKLEQNSLSLASTENELAYWQKEVENLSIEYENTRALFEEGIALIKEYHEIESKIEKARTEVHRLISKRNIDIREKLIIEEEIADANSNYESSKKILEKEVTQHELEKETVLQSMQNELNTNEEKMLLMGGTSPDTNNERDKGNMVMAEKNGTISELYFRNTGDYVTESDLLCTVVPAGSPLYLDITVANRDIGFIEKAMEIKYKFNAFPYNDYGILYGSVSAISPSAVEGKTQEFLYHVKGTLDKDFFGIRGKKYKIKAGMTATAELITERKSIFSFLFQKVKEKIKP